MENNQNLFQNILVAKVVKIEKHPDADKLYIVLLDIGKKFNLQLNLDNSVFNSENLVQVVTGARNIGINDFVPYLPPNFIVPGWFYDKNEEIKLESKKIRGVISHGMILAEDEIGIGNDHEGIFVLNQNTNKFDFSRFSSFDEIIGKSMINFLSKDILDFINEKIKKYNAFLQEVNKKLNLIKRYTIEIVGEEEVFSIIRKRKLKVYWGTAPTGKPSIGYFLPMIKISDFLKADCEVTILIANLHAYLDNMKSTWELLEYRSEYYKLLIKSILNRLKTPLDNLKFVIGTNFQLQSNYTLDMYKIATMTTVASVKGAGAEVVKQVENPVLGGMLYPILQALDEEYLQVDAQLGGIDQRKIFMYARECLPKLGYKKRIHIMHELIPGLSKSGKMSSSDPDSKIDFDDLDNVIKDKINKAYSVDGQSEGNALLAIIKYIVFYILNIENRSFIVDRPDEWGGKTEYKNYLELEKDFVEKKLSSVDLKPALAKEIINLIDPIREEILQNKDLLLKAYPNK